MITLRTASPADAEAIRDLVNSAYRGESSKRGWTTEADILGGQRTDLDSVLGMIRSPESRVELALSGNEMISGCVYLKREPRGDCYLGMLAVDPAIQAGGIGRKLLAHSEDVAAGWGSRRMRMTVIHLREELINYYERRGYRRTGLVEPFPMTNPRHGVPKVPELTLVELVKPLEAKVPS
jgi:ribosomal protein S18 acetylase RimI-like enzyme